jgi:hypothetical protein
MTNIFAQDIALDASGQAKVAANGELVLTTSPQTGVQDIRLRLDTYIESLFFDKGYGSTLRDWVMEENTELARIGFAAEVKRRIGEDPRVSVGSAYCSVTQWDELGIRADASWRFIDSAHVFNLVIEADHSKKEMVIRDADPAVV